MTSKATEICIKMAREIISIPYAGLLSISVLTFSVL